MHITLTGYKWEGAACLVSLAAAALTLYFGGPSPAVLFVTILLSVLGVCFGLSFLRTLPRAYRNLALAVLVIVAVACYTGLLLPWQ
jgi:hypothetical protein